MFVQSSRARSLSRGRWLSVATLISGLTTLAVAASAAPQITGFNAPQFQANSYITIYGTGFGNFQGSSYVLYGNRAIPIIAWNDLAITGYLTQGVLGTPLDAGVEPNVVVVRQPANEKSNAVPLPLAVAQTPTPAPGTDTGTTPGTPQPDTTTPGTATPAASETQFLNDALLVERMAAQFFNANATKAYLTTGVTNPSPGTNPPAAGTDGNTDNNAGALQDPGTTPDVTTPGTPAPGTVTPGTSTSSSLDALRSMVEEIRQHHNQHVSTLEQALGTNAQTAPTFQNLDATTLSQFLTMAQTIEDFAVSAHQGLLNSALGITTGGTITPGTTNPDGTANPVTTTPATGSVSSSILTTVLAIALDDARHAGAIRSYRKAVSTADGGDPTLTLTEDGGALNVARSRDQILAFIQPYLATGGTTTPDNTTNPPTNPTTTDPNTTNPTTNPTTNTPTGTP